MKISGVGKRNADITTATRVKVWLLRGFFIFALLFPAFYSPNTDVYQSPYYGGFSWAYLMLVLYMAVSAADAIKGRVGIAWKKWLPYIAVLAVYNLLSLYFNYKYLGWYWEQINNTVAFLAFMWLSCGLAKVDDGGYDNVIFLIRCIIISNAASIIYYFLGYTNLLICNNKFIFFELPENFYETRHYWIYSHKSEYALMLVAFIALIVAFRKRFKYRWTYLACLAILLVCLYLTHSWTGAAGVFLIFIGSFLDSVKWSDFHLRKRHIVGGAALIAAIAAVVYRIASERNLLTLGSRLQIWKTALGVIKKYPQGWGFRFGESMFVVEGTGAYVNNAHNVFLNAMLRFSIPVGVCFILLFVGIIIYSVIKSRSFLTAGMWAAALLLLNMDYSLMSLQMGLFLTIVSLVSSQTRDMRRAVKASE